MTLTQHEIEQLDHFFNNVNIPKEIKVNKALTYTDLPAFIHENLEKLKLGTLATIVAQARFDDLVRIKEVMISGEKF